MASKVGGLIEYIQPGGSSGTQHAIASTAYGYCETAGGTAIKTVEMTGFQLKEGVTIHVKFKEANSASNPKLKFNSEADTNAKPIVQYGTTAVGTTAATDGWQAGAVLALTYDGTSWVRDQGYNTNTTYSLSSLGGIGTISASGTSPLTLSGSKSGTSYTLTGSLADNYGDTKNPYASKTKNYVLAAPSNANGVPTFRALVAADIPAHGNHVPATQTANNLTFLRNDNTWYKIVADDVSTMINLLSEGTSPLTANDYLITQYAGGGTSNKTYYRRKASNVINGTLVKAALGTTTTTAKKFLKDTGEWTQVAWGDLTSIPSTFAPSAHEHNYLASRATINSGQNSPNNTHALALKKYFDDNKATIPRNALVNFYSSAYGNGSEAFGYYLANYDDSPYGGFFIAHYNTPKYVGIQGGTYSEDYIAHFDVSTTVTSGQVVVADGTNGKLKTSGYTIAKSVPSNAVFTDHYAWSDITSKPTTISGYGITDAKIASGVITLGSNTITPVTSVNGHTGNSVNVTVADLGLSTAMHFIGIATVAITDNSTTDPKITGYTFGTNGASAQAGDVIVDKDSSYEYVWTTAKKWERLGPDGSYKTVQTAITKPTAATNKWVSAIGQSANGNIDVSYGTLDTSGTWSGNAATASAVAWGNVTGKPSSFSPASHTHGNITNAGKIGTGNNLVVTSSGAISAGAAISSAISSQSTSTKFLREDGTWAAPSYIANTDTKVNVTAAAAAITKNYILMTSTAPTATATGHTALGSGSMWVNSADKGKFELVLGNATATSNAGGQYGQLALYSTSTAGTYLAAAAGSSWATATLQAKTGTIALTSDIPTNLNQLTNGPGYVTSSGVTSVATGAGLTGGTITGTGTIKAYLKSETKATYDSATPGNTQSRQYAVTPDKTGYLSVNVPWTDTNTLVNYTLGATTKAYLMASSNAPTSIKTAREAIGDTGVYLTATAGEISAVRHSYNVSSVEKAYTYFNSTTNSIDFVFI